ncbi:MAG: selenocysteine-specific translation elongation factor [Anaerolineae bacterium]|nr:selenocysteine-specific translation elongation factor [Anaerolineae bacterium]
MYVVGTAGHVDHGKSSLVRALTGIDPDRLKEEKAREMTIDLGFAWLTLPNGESIGIVDVPGHRDFVENMLAGVGGINAVLFVVAADEGAMPQTREHLAIIDLLRIPTGVIALTKTDLVSDPGWIDLVQLDLSEVMRGTVLENAPIIPVSVRTGAGLESLKQALAEQLTALPVPADVGQPRLWVDRVFSVSGFGTVVTGTLLDGQLVTGQEIELLPNNLRGRIRGLQSHQQTIETAHPGNRVAVNISGIDRSAVKRGNLLTLPGLITPTKLAAMRFHHLPDAPRPLKHNAEVKFFCGAAETVARVRLLDAESLLPGADGWLQLELRDPIPLIKGDRFILRSASPAETIGGGEVIDPAAGRRWRRNRPEITRHLEALARGNSAELVSQAIEAQSVPITLAQIESLTGLDAQTITAALVSVTGAVVTLDNGWWIGQAALDKLIERLTRILTGFHKAEPLRLGQRSEILRSQLGIDASELDVLLNTVEARGLIKRTRNGGIALTGHTVQPTKAQQAAIDRLMRTFADAPYTPPSPKEAAALVGEDVLAALIEWGDLIRIGPDVLFTPAVFDEIVSETQRIIASEGKVTIKTLRDRFNTSRKYAQAVLEYFDSLGVTRRVGDDHVVGSGEWARAASSAWGNR